MTRNSTSIRQRILDVEESLLSSVTGDHEVMQDFQDSFATLLADVNIALQTSLLDHDTISLAHTVASRVAIICQSFCDFQTQTFTLTNSMRDSLDGIFERINLNDEPRSKNLEPSPCPLFIAPAYRWLLKNLHNPYPSHETKESISRLTGASPDRVSAWFTNVRKRMGWTTISRKFYSNCRADTIEGAYRAFVEDDPKRPLEADIAYDFMMMKVTAEGLYSSKLKRSTLAGDLDAVIKDMTDENTTSLECQKVQNVGQKRRKTETSSQDRGKGIRNRNTTNRKKTPTSYPSPDRSLSNTPELHLYPLENGSEGGERLPDVPLSTKRRASSSDISSAEPYISQSQPNKRRKLGSETSDTLANVTIHSHCASLPSPLSRPITPESIASCDTAVPCTATSAFPVLGSLKRRLSGDVGEGPNRPRGLAVGPRLQTVSDPLPISAPATGASAFDSWCYFDFGLPPAVTSEEPDSSGPYDVEIFDWHALDGALQTQAALSDVNSPCHSSPQQSTRPDLELQSTDSSIAGLSSLSMTGTDGLDFLTFAEALHQPSLEDGSQSSGPNSRSSTAPNMMQLSTPLANEWTHLPLCFELPPESHVEDGIRASSFSYADDLFDISTASEFGPLLFHKPMVSTLDETENLEKRAKLEKLRAHREAVRKLEEELLSST